MRFEMLERPGGGFRLLDRIPASASRGTCTALLQSQQSYTVGGPEAFRPSAHKISGHEDHVRFAKVHISG